MNKSSRNDLRNFFGAILSAAEVDQVFVAASLVSHAPDNKPAMRNTHFTTHAELADAVLAMDSAGHEAYFALGRYAPHNTVSGQPGRKGEQVCALKSFWLDIDVGDDKAAKKKGYATKKQAAQAFAEFLQQYSLPDPSHMVDSGGGIHAYWAMDRDMPPDEWKQLSLKLKALANAQGFLADPSRTADIASVLRPPFTHNHKQTEPRDVKLKYSNPPITFTTWAAAINTAHATHCGNLNAVLPRTMPGNLSLGNNLKAPPPPETPQEIARVQLMLNAIPADCGYEQWRAIVWAIAATGWQCARNLARVWSESAPEKFNEASFQTLWDSFDPAGGIGFGTLHHYAKINGYQPPDPVTFTGTGEDVGNGKFFANTWHGKLQFVHETGDVLKFDSTTGWLKAEPLEKDRAAKIVLEEMHAQAIASYKAAPDDPKTKRLMAQFTRTSRAPNLRAMITMAESEPGMTRSLNDFDADPLQFGVINGVLDLRYLRLLPISPSLLVTKRSNVAYDPSATCPQWEEFLATVQPDPVIRQFLQCWVGYCLTGSVAEQKFVFLHGKGANGKSVFVELLAWLLGDYACKIATEMLMQHQRSPQTASPDIVSLKGRRFVYANETEEGRKLAEARIKEMTGGDTLTGRVPYGKADITFSPSHKLAIVGNHKPEIGDNSHGMWRRVCLIPFDLTIAESKRDAHLLEKLKNEGDGILNWALVGLKEWQQNGLSVPRKIEAATAAYRDEQDILAEWLSDCCITGAGLTARKDEIYRAYRKWASDNEHHPWAQKRLTRRLGERNFPMLPDKRTIGGLSLKPYSP